MKAKRCKTCYWSFLVRPLDEVVLWCNHEKRKFDSCADERRKLGNCGFQGKNWEAKND